MLTVFLFKNCENQRRKLFPGRVEMIIIFTYMSLLFNTIPIFSTGGKSSEELRAVEVPIQRHRKCSRRYSSLTKNMICTDTKGGKDACQVRIFVFVWVVVLVLMVLIGKVVVYIIYKCGNKYYHYYLYYPNYYCHYCWY